MEVLEGETEVVGAMEKNSVKNDDTSGAKAKAKRKKEEPQDKALL